MAQMPNVTITIKSSAPQPERGMFDVRVTLASVLNPDAPAGGTLYAAWCLNMNMSIPLGATASRA